MFQIRTVGSQPPETILDPLRLTATDITGPVWPSREAPDGPSRGPDPNGVIVTRGNDAVPVGATATA